MADPQYTQDFVPETVTVPQADQQAAVPAQPAAEEQPAQPPNEQPAAVSASDQPTVPADSAEPAQVSNLLSEWNVFCASLVPYTILVGVRLLWRMQIMTNWQNFEKRTNNSNKDSRYEHVTPIWLITGFH